MIRAAYHIGRIIFGAWFLFSGVEYFLPLDLQPLGHSALAREFTLAMIHSGLFAWVKVAEIAIGVLVLADRLMPATALAMLPLTVVIVYWNIVLEYGVVEYVFGFLTLAINLILLWPYRRYYAPLRAWKAAGAFDAAHGTRAIDMAGRAGR